MKILGFYASDDDLGGEVTSQFSEAAQVIVMHEDGSTTAKIVVMEGPVSIMLDVEIDIKSLLPQPQQPMQQVDMFGAWKRTSSTSGPIGNAPFMPQTTTPGRFG